MLVPDCWWNGFETRGLDSGKTHCFDEPTQKWLLLFDATDNDDECAMSCKAVCEHADIEAPTFDSCSDHLPADPMLDCGEDE